MCLFIKNISEKKLDEKMFKYGEHKSIRGIPSKKFPWSTPGVCVTPAHTNPPSAFPRRKATLTVPSGTEEPVTVRGEGRGRKDDEKLLICN
jgi:hypothetical protein